ncbi:MAG: hypothetical protein J1E16_00105 [Muribaculaceae bacterium]|nr:hypothetical protein [Muribaculaceae bacterium]
MRLFVFAIGGTGSRVLRSLVMQLAAGVVPVDPITKKPLENFTLVPLIIDPHTDNASLQRANDLLLKYRNIHNDIYGESTATKGFYAVKVATLKDICTSNKSDTSVTYKLPEGFFFDMPEIAATEFKNFIGLNDPDVEREAKLFSKMIFSEEELNTKMSEGFYGSPNIGTVALNVFQKSDSFSALLQNFNENDRIIFIGSIFGGTGAAGLPMLASSFRNLRGDYKDFPLAQMAAIIVMPYFSIAKNEYSEIQEADFIIKTKSALKYYEKDLNPYLNDIYYLADTQKPLPFENDPGKGGQGKNAAHIVELIGAMAVLEFAQKPVDDTDVTEIENRRRIVKEINRKCWEFSLSTPSNEISFIHLSKDTNDMISVPMIKYHIFTSFIKDGHFNGSLTDAYAKETGLSNAAVSIELDKFIDEYRAWLYEMSQHGDQAHNFIPFTRIVNLSKDYSGIINDVNMKKGTLGYAKIDKDDIIQSLNGKRNDYRNQKDTSMISKLLGMGFEALDKILDSKFELSSLKNK